MLTILILTTAPNAAAQIGDSPWDVSQEVELALLLAPGGSVDGAPERERALYEVGLGLSAERTFQSGWTLGGRGVFRAAQDHPDRPGGIGNILTNPSQGAAGGYSRLAAGPDLDDEGARGSLETAYLFLETGYGEISLGRDTGVAARFHEGNVSAVSRGRLLDPYLDVTGISGLNTRANLTGPSTKLSYVTPRLLGVRAGVSYTPRSDVRGLDRDATDTISPPQPELENVFEFGVNASRRLRESGVRLRGGVSYSVADLDAPNGFESAYDDSLDVFSAGAEVEWKDTYRLGLSWLSADEGLASSGDYTAWSAGLGYDRGDWRASLEYAEADIDAAGANASGYAASISRRISDVLQLGLSWQDLDVSSLRSVSVQPAAPSAESSGIVVEITLSFQN
ncbi:MAG: porin [Pseudomonadota bacterium]